MYFRVFDKNGNDITKDEYWMITSKGEIISIDDVYAILYFNDGTSRTVFDEKEKNYTICAKHFYKEAIKEFAERLKEKIINTPFGVDCTGETDEYREGCLRGLVAKQHNVIDMVDNLLKEMVGEEE